MEEFIPEIRRILFPTDLSENARYAFGYAVSLANRYGAAITILHVVEDISPTSDSLVISIVGRKKWEELKKNKEQKILDTIQERLETFCEEVGRGIPSCPFVADEILVKIGNPVELILRQIEKSRCDLVVMGTHGHGVIADAMMGSTSRRVSRRSKKPVLLVRLPEEDEGEPVS